MLNIIWLSMIIIAVIVGAINGKIPEVVASVTVHAKLAFELALGLAGILALWLGLMKIAEEGGLIRSLARLLHPLMRRLFPDVPTDHPAMGSMILTISANMLGLSNAATPFGLRAMNELETLNKQPGTATNAMCTFLAINTANVQLIPATAIAYLAAAGAARPTDIIATTVLATTIAMTAGLITVKTLERLKAFRIKPSTPVEPQTEVRP